MPTTNTKKTTKSTFFVKNKPFYRVNFLFLFLLLITSRVQAQLIFSEYIDGPGNYNFIEIYNASGTVINLNEYRIAIYNDGSPSPSIGNGLTLSGQLGPNGVAVYRSPGLADPQFTSFTPLLGNFDGNDAIGLSRGGALIDVIGNIGCNPGAGGWSSNGRSTKNGGIIRKPCVQVGASDPTGNCPMPTLSSQWTTNSNTNYGNLGFHNGNSVSVDAGLSQEGCVGETFTLSASAGGTNYSWSNGEIGQNISVSPLQTTTYEVTATFGGCMSRDQVTITVKPLITMDLNVFGPYCSDDGLQNIPSRQQSSQGPVFGNWSGTGISGNGFQIDPSGLNGTYTITYIPNQNPGDCYEVATTTFTVMPSAAPTLSPLGEVCEADGPVSLPSNVQGFDGVWSGNGVRNNIFNPTNLQGTIPLQFTPSGACAIPATTTISVQRTANLPPPNFGAVCSASFPIPLGDNINGYLGVWVGNGVSNNTFDPRNQSGNVGLIFTPTAGQCARPVQTSIQVIPQGILVLDRFEPICDGEEAFNLPTEQNGINGNWSGNGVSNNVFNPSIGAGTYNLTFTTSEGQCSQTRTEELEVLDGIKIVETNPMPAACGANIGSIYIETLGGDNLNKEYSIDGINYVTSPEFTNLSAGAYTIYARDNNCTTKTTIQITATPAVAITGVTVVQEATCEQLAEVAIEATGTGTLFYSMTGQNFDRNNNFDNLEMGTYKFIVRDGNFCFDTLTYDLIGATAPEVINLEIGTTSCGLNNGILTISAIGTGDLIYSIDGVNYQFSNEFNNLSPADYTIFIKDENDCISNERATILASNPLQILSTSVENATCSENNGRLTINAQNNGSPLQYALNEGSFQSSPVFSNLATGTYTIQVRDGEGCTTSSAVNVDEEDAPAFQNPVLTPATCEEANGSIEVLATGSSSLSYALNGGNFQMSNVFSNLPEGDYEISVRDANNCILSDVVTLTGTSVPEVERVGVANAHCSQSDGSLRIIAEGEGLSYSLDGQNFQAANEFSNLPSGNYQVVVRNQDNCDSEVFEVMIGNEAAPRISRTSLIPARCEAPNGAMSIITEGGTGMITYAIDGQNFQTENTFTNLAAGTYELTIMDEAGCTASQSTTIQQIEKPQQASLSTSPATCNENNGAVNFSATGGTGALTYSLNDSPFQSNGIFTNLSRGIYTLIVKDSEGCTSEFPITILGTELTEIESISNTPSTCGLNNASIKITLANPDENIEYSLNNVDYQSFGEFDDLAAGDYTIYVRNAENCITTASTSIIANPSPSIITVNTIATNCSMATGQIEVETTGGMGILSYSLDNENFQIEAIFTNLVAANYTIYVKDENDCIATEEAVINEAGSPDISNIQTSPANCHDENGALRISLNGDITGVTYSINGIDFQTGDTFTNLSSGNYEIIVEAENGCKSTQAITLSKDDGTMIEELMMIMPTCEMENGQIEAFVDNSSASVQYSLDNEAFQTTNLFTNLAAGNYEVYIKDQDNCTDIFATTLTNEGNPETHFETTTTCDENAIGMDTIYLQNRAGCDSIIITTTSFVDKSETALTAMTCDQNAVGLDTTILQNALGCDSLVITETFYTEAIETHLTEIVCEQNEVGMDTLFLMTSMGCDSLIITASFFASTTESYTTQLVCDENEVGRDTIIRTNVAGCDSLVITEFLYQSPSETYQEALVCSETEVRQDTVVLMSAAGCDSLIITAYFYQSPSENFQEIFVCTPAEAGQDTIKLTSIGGCDSLVITTSIFAESSVVYFTQTVCEESIVGLDTIVLTNITGCDSLVITASFFAPTTASFETISICDGDPNQAGLDTTIVQNSAGCDSLIIKEYIILTSSETTLYSTTCDPMEVGLFTTVLTNAVGCDSVVIRDVALRDINNCEVQLSTSINDLLCHGDRSGSITFSVNIGVPPFSYTYNNESGLTGTGTINNANEDVVLSDLPAGFYTLSITSAEGLNTVQEIEIKQPDGIRIDAQSFPPGCQNPLGSIRIHSLNGGTAPYAYSLNGTNFTSINAYPFRLPNELQSGAYNLTIIDANDCVNTEEIIVEERSELISNLAENVVINLGDSVQLDPLFNFIPSKVEWTQPDNISCINCEKPTVTPFNTNLYTVTGTDEYGCSIQASILVVVEKEREIYVPTVFSPNGDGHNDRFSIFAGTNVQQVNFLRVYNYYGDPVFELYDFPVNEEVLGWDGTFRGKKAQSNTYIYLTEILFVDGVTQLFQGDVTLMR